MATFADRARRVGPTDLVMPVETSNAGARVWDVTEREPGSSHVSVITSGLETAYVTVEQSAGRKNELIWTAFDA